MDNVLFWDVRSDVNAGSFYKGIHLFVDLNNLKNNKNFRKKKKNKQ